MKLYLWALVFALSQLTSETALYCDGLGKTTLLCLNVTEFCGNRPFKFQDLILDYEEADFTLNIKCLQKFMPRIKVIFKYFIDVYNAFMNGYAR